MEYIPETTQNMIDQMLVEYPPYMQDAFARFAWQEGAAHIAAKYRLSQEQSQRFIVEVALMLLGVEEAGLFPQTLMNHIGVSEDIANQISLDVVERIVEGLQDFILEENRDIIHALQGEYENLQEQEHHAALREQGIEIEEDDESEDDSNTDLDTSSMAPTHDPYHEPLHDLDAHLETPQATLPPVPTPPAPQKVIDMADTLRDSGMIVPPPPLPKK